MRTILSLPRCIYMMEALKTELASLTLSPSSEVHTVASDISEPLARASCACRKSCVLPEMASPASDTQTSARRTGRLAGRLKGINFGSQNPMIKSLKTNFKFAIVEAWRATSGIVQNSRDSESQGSSLPQVSHRSTSNRWRPIRY